MKSQIIYFLLTLMAVSAFFGLMFIISSRHDMLMVIGLSALVGPFSGLFWTDNLWPGLKLVATGLSIVLALVVGANLIVKYPEIRLVTVALAGILWFCFGVYGIGMLA